MNMRYILLIIEIRKKLKKSFHSIPVSNVPMSSLHGCLEQMSDMEHNNLQNDIITFGEHNSIMHIQGGPLSSNSSIVNI